MELFLDANAHVPINNKISALYSRYSKESWAAGHPSSLNCIGRKAATKLEYAREIIAETIGAKEKSQIIFTSGCTQAAEWIVTIMRKHFRPEEITVSPIEHPAVRDSVERYFGKKIDKIEVNEIGEIKNWNQEKKAAVCIYLQNEFGAIQDLNKFENAWLFSDTSQALGKMEWSLKNWNHLQASCFSSHKFGGPPGLGWMYLKDISWWEPLDTGSRYFMDRAGTPDVLGTVIMAEALQDCLKSLKERMYKMKEFSEYIEPELKELGFEIIGDGAKNRSSNTTLVYFSGRCAEFLLKLSEKGIYVGSGSACGSMHSGLSPSLKAIGRGGGTQDYLRISQFGEYGRKEAEYFVKILQEIIRS